jgi:hypothetical protein
MRVIIRLKYETSSYLVIYYNIFRPWQPLTYLYFPYCISLIYFSFSKIRMFLYAQIYWLAEFGDVSCLQFESGDSHSHSHSDLGGFCRTILRVTLSSSPTKLCVRPESMIVDTLGGICRPCILFFITWLVNLFDSRPQKYFVCLSLSSFYCTCDLTSSIIKFFSFQIIFIIY